MDWCLELPGMWLLKKWDALRSSYSPPSDGSKVSVYHRAGMSLCTQEGTSCPAPKGSLESSSKRGCSISQKSVQWLRVEADMRHAWENCIPLLWRQKFWWGDFQRAYWSIQDRASFDHLPGWGINNSGLTASCLFSFFQIPPWRAWGWNLWGVVRKERRQPTFAGKRGRNHGWSLEFGLLQLTGHIRYWPETGSLKWLDDGIGLSAILGPALVFVQRRQRWNSQLGKRMEPFSIASPHSQVLLVQSSGYISTERRETLTVQHCTQWYLNWALKDAMELLRREKRKAGKCV